MTTPNAPVLLMQVKKLPLVAILRGLEVAMAEAIGKALMDAGIRTVEVPLNRLGAIACIEKLAKILPADAIIGGGTVLSVEDVNAVHAAGGKLIVSPNFDVRVVERALALDMLCAPGVATPTEAFAALQAGAHALKVFPAEMVGIGGLKAMKSVLPVTADLWPVGGITPASMKAWKEAGATGFGIGGQMFTPGFSPGIVSQRANDFIKAWHALPKH